MKFEVHGHISGSNSLVNLLTPVVKNLQIFSAVTLVGLLIAITFFIREERGKLSSEGLRVKTLARLAAVIWSVATLGVLLFDLANILDSSIGQTLDLVVIRSFISQTSLGTALFINLAAAAAVAGSAPGSRRTSGYVSHRPDRWHRTHSPSRSPLGCLCRWNAGDRRAAIRTRSARHRTIQAAVSPCRRRIGSAGQLSRSIT